MTARRQLLIQLAFFSTLLLAWEAAVRGTGTGGLVPYPTGIIEAAVRAFADGTLVAASLASLHRVLLGLAIGGALGVPLGLVMGLLRPMRRALGPIVDALRSIAPIAWIPMALLWLGIRGNAALFIVAYAAFFPFVLNTVQAVRLIDRKLVDAASALGASSWLILRTVVLPSAIPMILTGARIALGFAWGSIIAAELAIGIKVSGGGTAAIGLGQLMVATLYIRRDVDSLVLFMLVIGIVSLVLDRGMQRLQRVLAPWQQA